jgi:hypothetical protein
MLKMQFACHKVDSCLAGLIRHVLDGHCGTFFDAPPSGANKDKLRDLGAGPQEGEGGLQKKEGPNDVDLEYAKYPRQFVVERYRR